jgi:hypothetical protein
MNDKTPRNIAKVCGNCYVDIRKGEYEPEGGDYGNCAACDDYTIVHRVKRSEAIAHAAIITAKYADQCESMDPVCYGRKEGGSRYCWAHTPRIFPSDRG